MSESCSNSGVSRRSVLLAAAAAAPLLALTGGEAQAKLAMTAVKYQPDPKDGKQCDGCNFFVAPNSCKMVDGDIATLCKPVDRVAGEGRFHPDRVGREDLGARLRQRIHVHSFKKKAPPSLLLVLF